MITSLQHPLVKHFLQLRLERNYRIEQQKVIIEGVKPILELRKHLKQVLFTSSYAAHIQDIPLAIEVTEGIMQKISGMRSPEGLIAEVEMPSFVSIETCSYIIAFDGVSDPGNLGTLLRTAVAFGWEGAYFLPGGCDPYNDKVLRAARGAHFKLKLAQGNIKDLHHLMASQKREGFVANIQGTPLNEIKPANQRLLILGNEAHGPSALTKQLFEPLTIPMQSSMESLNVAVAGGILLYNLAKGEGPKHDA